MQSRKILILGASYGSLLGMKLALAGHDVKLVCLPEEAKLMNEKGAIVRIPVKGREGLTEVNTKSLPGKVAAGGTTDFDPKDFDLVALAMQEPQYRVPAVRAIFERRFGRDRFEAGDEFVSIANGLATIGLREDAEAWAVQSTG